MRESVGEIQPRKNRTPFAAITVVDSSDDVGPNNSSESNTRSHAVILKADVLEVIEHLSGIQEWRDLEVRDDARYLGTCQMNTFLDAERQEMLIDETINAKSA